MLFVRSGKALRNSKQTSTDEQFSLIFLSAASVSNF